MLADMIATAKITSKGQTTIPQSIRDALHIKPGDRVIWEVSADGAATMRRVQEPSDAETELRDLESTLSEWNSAADEVAYRDL
jgi:AbrB family looped-hinge helix DNA binding protein